MGESEQRRAFFSAQDPIARQRRVGGSVVVWLLLAPTSPDHPEGIGRHEYSCCGAEKGGGVETQGMTCCTRGEERADVSPAVSSASRPQCTTSLETPHWRNDQAERSNRWNAIGIALLS